MAKMTDTTLPEDEKDKDLSVKESAKEDHASDDLLELAKLRREEALKENPDDDMESVFIPTQGSKLVVEKKHLGADKESHPHVEVIVNGTVHEIPTGRSVRVPKNIAEIIRNAQDSSNNLLGASGVPSIKYV